MNSKERDVYKDDNGALAMKGNGQVVDPYDTQLEFWGKFYFSPTITGYEELDKNLTTTNLSRRFKEPEMARHILQVLHILNKYKIKKKTDEVVGYKRYWDEDEEEYVKKPVYNVVVTHLYEKSVNYFLSKFYSLVTTSAAAGGFKTKAFNTRRNESSQTVRDMTESPKMFNFFGRRNKEEQFGG